LTVIVVIDLFGLKPLLRGRERSGRRSEGRRRFGQSEEILIRGRMRERGWYQDMRREHRMRHGVRGISKRKMINA